MRYVKHGSLAALQDLICRLALFKLCWLALHGRTQPHNRTNGCDGNLSAQCSVRAPCGVALLQLLPVHNHLVALLKVTQPPGHLQQQQHTISMRQPEQD
jgi:hypothetical protein